MLTFNSDKIDVWMEQSYQYAKRCTGFVIGAMKGIKHTQRSVELRDSVLDELDSYSFKV